MTNEIKHTNGHGETYTLTLQSYDLMENTYDYTPVTVGGKIMHNNGRIVQLTGAFGDTPQILVGQILAGGPGGVHPAGPEGEQFDVADFSREQLGWVRL